MVRGSGTGMITIHRTIFSRSVAMLLITDMDMHLQLVALALRAITDMDMHSQLVALALRASSLHRPTIHIIGITCLGAVANVQRHWR